MSFQTIWRRHPSHRRALLLSRLRTPRAAEQVASGHRRLKWRRARLRRMDQRAQRQPAQRAKAQGGIRGRSWTDGRARDRLGQARRAEQDGRQARRAASIGRATERLIATLASLADRGFLPRYRGRGGMRPWEGACCCLPPTPLIRSRAPSAPQARLSSSSEPCRESRRGSAPGAPARMRGTEARATGTIYSAFWSRREGTVGR